MLNIGSVELPLSAATKTFAILAKRGAGKSYTAAVMAEEFFRAGVPFVVFDPIDVWWGLRLAADGKEKGLPIVVFGLEHADIQLNRDMGRQIAREIVKQNISCVISTFGMPKVAQRHLIAEFADELLNINNTPRHIFIEEAHEFVPQRVFGGLGKTFNAVSNLVVMGRNRGIGVTLINQRAATINKDVLTQIDTLLAFQNVSPQDRSALKEWVEHHAADGDFELFMSSLPNLHVGHGWIWSPEFLNVFKQIEIRKRRTFHPDREKLGMQFEMPQLSQMDVQQFIEQFKASIQQPKKEAEITAVPEPKRELPELTALRNDYESRLMQKEIEIRRLNDTISNVRKAVGTPESSSYKAATNRGNAELWISKLGNSGAARILKFLADKTGMKFTKSQIGLGVGLQASSGSFATYMATLKRNNLIIKDGDCFRINPDL
jgi:hypothetical protein